MRRQGSLLTMAAIVLGLSAFAGYLRSTRSGGPKLEIENPGQLILGKVSVQDPCLRTVRIKNVGNLAIRRGKFQVSCGCSRVTPSAFALPPGEAVDVQLEFDFLSLTNQHEIPVAREFSVALQALSQAPVPAVFQWPFRGVIHSVYQRVPAVVEFATRAPPSDPVTGEVEFRFHEPIERLLVSSDDAGVAVQMDDAGPGKAFRCGVGRTLRVRRAGSGAASRAAGGGGAFIASAHQGHRPAACRCGSAAGLPQLRRGGAWGGRTGDAPSRLACGNVVPGERDPLPARRFVSDIECGGGAGSRVGADSR